MSADFFDDVIFPTSISLYSFKGKRSRRTRVVTTRAGFDQRKSEWAQTLRTFDAGMVTRPASQWRAIDELFDIVEGAGVGFLLQDPTDYQVTQAQGVVSLIAGDAYSLQKIAMLGTHTTYRGIAKPRLGSVNVYRTRASVTTLISTGAYTLDYTTGILTFVPAYVVAGDTYAWSGDFYLPVRFATDDLDWQTIDKQPQGELLIAGPSIPITEMRWPGMLYVPPT